MSSVGTLKSVKRMPAAKTLPRIAAGDFTRDLDIAQDELLALLDLAQQVKSSFIKQISLTPKESAFKLPGVLGRNAIV